MVRPGDAHQRTAVLHERAGIDRAGHAGMEAASLADRDRDLGVYELHRRDLGGRAAEILTAIRPGFEPRLSGRRRRKKSRPNWVRLQVCAGVSYKVHVQKSKVRRPTTPTGNGRGGMYARS